MFVRTTPATPGLSHVARELASQLDETAAEIEDTGFVQVQFPNGDPSGSLKSGGRVIRAGLVGHRRVRGDRDRPRVVTKLPLAGIGRRP